SGSAATKGVRGQGSGAAARRVRLGKGGIERRCPSMGHVLDGTTRSTGRWRGGSTITPGRSNAVKSFIAKHRQKINGVLECFDRMILRGHLPMAGVGYFLGWM